LEPAISSDAPNVFLCFDANLPKLENCEPNCEQGSSPLCIHRFDFQVKIEYCNGAKFHGWSDLRIFIYFLGRIFESIADGSVASTNSVFMFLTKDRNFIDDVKKEWEESEIGAGFDFVFAGDCISCGSLVVFIQQIDRLAQGHGKKKDSQRRVFKKVNDFFANIIE